MDCFCGVCSTHSERIVVGHVPWLKTVSRGALIIPCIGKLRLGIEKVLLNETSEERKVFMVEGSNIIVKRWTLASRADSIREQTAFSFCDLHVTQNPLEGPRVRS